MNELVLLHHLAPMTTSEVIAVGVEMEHKAVIQLVRKYAGELQKFGEVAFEMRLNAQGSPTEFAWLNEQQATFLVTLMRNSPRVVEFKVALIQAFFAMHDALRDRPTPRPVLSANPAHVADLTVSGWRTFRALLGVCRSSGMKLPEALRRANAATIEKTGINMLAEIDAEDYPETLAAQALQQFVPFDRGEDQDSRSRFFRAWIEGSTPHPVCLCASGDFYRAYSQWCAKGIERPESHNRLSAYVLEQKGWRILPKNFLRSSGRSYSGEDVQRVRCVIPPQDLLEATRTDQADYRKRPQQSEGHWATASMLAFAASLG